MKKAILTVIAMSLIGGYIFANSETNEVTYTRTVRERETLWDIASEVARPEDDVRRIIYAIRKQNDIKNPGDIQTGTVLTFTLKR